MYNVVINGREGDRGKVVDFPTVNQYTTHHNRMEGIRDRKCAFEAVVKNRPEDVSFKGETRVE